ncbi:ribosome recycling factor [bacterium]|nr:ribosome recycling factor [bacterium]
MEKLLNDTKAHMDRAIDALKKELGQVRTGRASLIILDDLRVEYYGQQVPFNQVATLNIPEPRLIAIQPWEPKMIQAIEKSILTADLGLNPVNDGKTIKLPIPALNEERRKSLVKQIKKYGEETKVSVRNSRHDANDVLKTWEKDKKFPEDEIFRLHKRVQDLTDEFIKKVDETIEHKEKDIMEV